MRATALLPRGRLAARATLLVFLLIAIPTAAAGSSHAVTLSPGTLFSLTDTRVSCEVLDDESILCATSTSSDPFSAGYSAVVGRKGQLLLESAELGGVRLVYASGTLKSIPKFTKRRAVNIRAGDVVLLHGSTSGCSVGAAAVRCASSIQAGGSPVAGSKGFVARSDGSVTMVQFGKATKTLYKAAPASLTGHNTYTLNVGDVFGVSGTDVGCGVGAPAALNVTLILCQMSSGPNGSLDGTYATVTQADGRVIIGQFQQGSFTTLYTRALQGASELALPVLKHADVEASVGDLIRVAGLSLSCRIGELDAGSHGKRKFVLCGIRDEQGFRSNSNIALLEQDDIAVAARLDATRKVQILFAKP